MENPIKMDDLGVPLFLETPVLFMTVEMTILHSLLVKTMFVDLVLISARCSLISMARKIVTYIWVV